MGTTFTVGAATITRIEETYAPIFHAAEFFPDWRPEVARQHQGWMVPHHYDASSGFLRLSIHSWLAQMDGRTIVIDTCVGNSKARPTRPFWHLMQTRYLDRLLEAGVRPDQVDLVLCTHLHADHVGWNTRADAWPLRRAARRRGAAETSTAANISERRTSSRPA